MNFFHLEQACKKTESSSCFDVTMGSYNGAEPFELIGLYRDDGLIVLNKVTSQNTDEIRKKIIQVFQNNGFSIDIMTN